METEYYIDLGTWTRWYGYRTIAEAKEAAQDLMYYTQQPILICNAETEETVSIARWWEQEPDGTKDVLERIEGKGYYERWDDTPETD